MADTCFATVGEFVAHLQKFPPETPIFIDAWHDDDEVERVGIPHHWPVDRVGEFTWRERQDGGDDKALILSWYSP